MRTMTDTAKKIVTFFFRQRWFVKTLSFLLPWKCKIPVDVARQTLNSYSPKPKCSTCLRNSMANSEPQTCDLQIIIPCYNVETCVRQCIDSVLTQCTGFSFRVIAVDDGSCDNTYDVLSSYRDDRLFVIRKENGGAASARNAALERVTGRYIMFVDADDTLTPNAIESLLTTAFREDADIVQGSFSLVELNSPKTIQQYFDCRMNAYDVPGYPWGKVYRSALFGSVQYPEGYWYEDTMNYLLLHQEYLSVYSVSNVVYNYVISSSSVTVKNHAQKRCVESYWVTELLLNDAKVMGTDFDAAYLKKLESQFLINSRRVAKLPLNIQKCIFVLQGHLVEEYYKKDDALNTSCVINCLLKRQFWRYYVFLVRMILSN